MMKFMKRKNPAEKSPPKKTSAGEHLILLGTWLISLSAVVLALFAGWQSQAQAASNDAEALPAATLVVQSEAMEAAFEVDPATIALPELDIPEASPAISLPDERAHDYPQPPAEHRDQLHRRRG